MPSALIPAFLVALGRSTSLPLATPSYSGTEVLYSLFRMFKIIWPDFHLRSAAGIHSKFYFISVSKLWYSKVHSEFSEIVFILLHNLVAFYLDIINMVTLTQGPYHYHMINYPLLIGIKVYIILNFISSVTFWDRKLLVKQV